MANYRTCHNCRVDRNECATRGIIKQAVAGLHVTSIKFTCPDRAPLYRAGDRVSVTWLVNAEIDDHYPADYNEETWPATVIGEVGPRWLICVDDVPSDLETPARDYIKSGNLYCKVSAGKLAPLDEPKRCVCDLCGLVGGNGFEECWQQGTVPHPKCLRSIASGIEARSDETAQQAQPEGQEPARTPKLPLNPPPTPNTEGA